MKILEDRIEDAKRVNNRLREEMQKMKSKKVEGGASEEMKKRVHELERENRSLKESQ